MQTQISKVTNDVQEYLFLLKKFQNANAANPEIRKLTALYEEEKKQAAEKQRLSKMRRDKMQDFLGQHTNFMIKEHSQELEESKYGDQSVDK